MTKKPKVYNQRNKTLSGRPPPTAIYVGRPSDYGNPFPLQEEKDRIQIVEQYGVWIQTQPALIAKSRRISEANTSCAGVLLNHVTQM